jgi:hypothetical protein
MPRVRQKPANVELPQAHKCLGISVTYRISVNCECGWRSTEHTGVGAQKRARAEWKTHAAKHSVTPQGAPTHPSKSRRRSEA